ncbi:MAG: hypothetical protein K6E28_06370 [Eubacterium sp.]|nr:hypothetical protein [Eubacterium sp.]
MYSRCTSNIRILRKIFINIIPGIKLKEEDQEKVDNLLRKHSGNIVVELTEQAELEDDTLEALKNHLRDLDFYQEGEISIEAGGKTMIG